MENPATWTPLIRRFNAICGDFLNNLAVEITNDTVLSFSQVQDIIFNTCEEYFDAMRRYEPGLSFGAKLNRKLKLAELTALSQEYERDD